MQTEFSLAQLADPDIQAANDILRKCVHCGFCTATCPTYVLLGDELDSPRGRIYQIKGVLQGDQPAAKEFTKHIDRCLSCLSCTTTCPSGVDYMHLVDHARAVIEKDYTRPLPERMLREILAVVLPRPKLFRLSLFGAILARPIAKLLPGRLKNLVGMAPRSIPAPSVVDTPQVFPANGERRMRVALMTGCAQQVLRPGINEATVRLLRRHGAEVVIARGGGCCGALVHHMGREVAAHGQARANILAWERAEQAGGAFDAIVINASGCGTTVKDYGWMLRNDPAWADRAARISSLTKDITEIMLGLGLTSLTDAPRPVVTYHSACSMQHGQKLKTQPVELLRAAGFEVRQPLESHLCCGSAGTYNLMQPELAEKLKIRKLANITATHGDIVATGNIGCLVQLTDDKSESLPVVHTAELLDWATGGPRPSEMARISLS